VEFIEAGTGQWPNPWIGEEKEEEGNFLNN
jgi:hypothetical protein